MTRVQRLSHARAKWGLEPPPCVKTFIRHYANWFRIDRLCAAVEVQKLGFPVDPTYVAQLRLTFSTPRRKKKQVNPPPPFIQDQDENFAFIMGYTSGGAPFGVTWEEWDQIKDSDT